MLSGKDKGKHGTIALVVRKLNKVYVEGLNTVSKIYLLFRRVIFGRYLIIDNATEKKTINPNT